MDTTSNLPISCVDLMMTDDDDRRRSQLSHSSTLASINISCNCKQFKCRNQHDDYQYFKNNNCKNKY